MADAPLWVRLVGHGHSGGALVTDGACMSMVDVGG